MRSRRTFHAVDSPAEAMPTSLAVGGVGTIPGATMAERRLWFMADGNDVRTQLMYEPRGHAAMSGATPQPPTRPDADDGVVNESFTGTRSTGRLLGTMGGRPAVLASITGRTWVTGSSQFHLDPTDPFPAGSLL
ncbi:proline racemase family protein [Streptomyces luomodiensis]|uniref:Proline racemase family protein n=1 Tax=Streptomyces luomodiensis TaxID=3026192 RepID=A0ABY9V8P4_9ACTN|nr:proline racemase family protein [Streptomyces sp. SCA4-21]WNF01263.1 proline racemase family protein [Streptomyces sp. SCA4-21]